MKYEEKILILAKAITNLHPGTAKGGEMVDVPIQRDWFGFPTIYSSSLKGAIKSYVWHEEDVLAEYLFGQDQEPEFSSPITITDAFLLVFPVRSLKGIYAYATSPFLLKRFREYIELSGKAQDIGSMIDNILKNFDGKTALCSNVEKLKVYDENALINEEFLIQLRHDKNVEELKNKLNLDSELIVISDDESKNMVEKSLIRLTRIRLERNTKTVQKGGLWDEEYMPLKSILFFTAFISKIDENIIKKMKEKEKYKNILNKIDDGNAQKLAENLNKLLDDKVVIIGGHETIGCGLIKLKFFKSEQT